MGISIKNINVSSLSPMMQHYVKTKEEYSDCILFYRLGDFYEMFFEDHSNRIQRTESSPNWKRLWYGGEGAHVRRSFSCGRGLYKPSDKQGI